MINTHSYLNACKFGQSNKVTKWPEGWNRNDYISNNHNSNVWIILKIIFVNFSGYK